MQVHNTPATVLFHAAAVAVAVAAATLALAAGYAQGVHAQFQEGGVDMEGSWYVGEGLKHGDYFSYSMCHEDYKECSKFRLDLWIRDDVQIGGNTKWLAETVVYDGDRIVRGQMALGKISAEPIEYTANLGAYRYAFKSSVVWLSAFATADSEPYSRGSKEFRDTSWGTVGEIGGPQLRPLALETVKAAGQDWDAVLIGWKNGPLSKVWIVDGFPFPIKARAYPYVTGGMPSSVAYEFILLKYEENVKENPFADVVGTDEQLVLQCGAHFDKNRWIKKLTVVGMYQVHVCYGPEEPRQGGNMQWMIKFTSRYDETEFLNQVQFDVLAMDKDMLPTRSLAAEDGRRVLHSPSGQYLIDIPVREDPGEVSYVIWVWGRAPEGLIPSDPPDYVEIPITVREGSGVANVPAPGVDESSAPTVEPETDRAPIPSWVRISAGWWAEGMIDDDSFVQAIQFLIQNGVMAVSPPS